MEDDSPSLGMVAMLIGVPAKSVWRMQEEVEGSLGLEPGSISRFFMELGRRGSKIGAGSSKKVMRDLNEAGVFRHQNYESRKRVRWLAFVGKGGKKPVFSDRGEGNSILQEKGGAVGTGPQPAVAPPVTPREGGSSAARVGEDEHRVSEVMQRRYVQ